MTTTGTFWKRSARWSLKQRQLAVFGVFLSVLALLLGIGGALFINRVAQGMSDHLLAGSVQSIEETVAAENGQLTLDISPNALAMLASGGRNRVFYSVRQGKDFLTGYETFPVAPVSNGHDGDLSFRYSDYLGTRVRVATVLRWLPRVPSPAVIQIATSLDETRLLARTMLIGLVILEAVLVAFAVILLWPAMGWAVRPLTALRREIETHTPSGRATIPLNASNAPLELAGLIEAFNDLLGRMDQASARMSRFTADASHQMRTPLAALRAHVDLLRSVPRHDATIDGSLQDIDEAVKRLQRLVTQLLALARAEGTARIATCPKLSVNSALRATCCRLAAEAHRAGVDIRFAEEGDLALPIEPILLDEMIGNVIDNAIKYHETGSYVLVKVSGSGLKGLIIVEDDGQGIPEDQASHVGERFFRMPRDQHRPGSGLGLSIAQAICERAGGTFRVETSSPRPGVRVTFEFGQPMEGAGCLVPASGGSD